MNIFKILTPKRRLGNLGENAAARYLRKHGYKILERSYEGKWGEIDIIAKKKNVFAFIEVKTRSKISIGLHEPRPAAAVDPEKQRRLIRIANEYARRIHKPEGCPMRMDIVEVITKKDETEKTKIESIYHIENAFDMNSAYHRR